MRGARSYSPIPKIKKRKKCELELRWEGKGGGMRKLGEHHKAGRQLCFSTMTKGGSVRRLVLYGKTDM